MCRRPPDLNPDQSPIEAAKYHRACSEPMPLLIPPGGIIVETLFAILKFLCIFMLWLTRVRTLVRNEGQEVLVLYHNVQKPVRRDRTCPAISFRLRTTQLLALCRDQLPLVSQALQSYAEGFNGFPTFDLAYSVMP